MAASAAWDLPAAEAATAGTPDGIRRFGGRTGGGDEARWDPPAAGVEGNGSPGGGGEGVGRRWKRREKEGGGRERARARAETKRRREYGCGRQAVSSCLAARSASNLQPRPSHPSLRGAGLIDGRTPIPPGDVPPLRTHHHVHLFYASSRPWRR